MFFVYITNMFNSMVAAAKELYKDVIGCVCRHTGFDESLILISNKEECVDARYILVHILSQWLTDTQIAMITGLSRTCANKIRNTFYQKHKLKFSIRLTLQDIVSELESNDISHKYPL